MSQASNDCYFFYYSSCSKGSSCPFRHEPAALNQETVCSFWKQGKCTKPHCSFRHMNLEKDRRNIPCFWESQPTGCTKPHCPFLHEAPKDQPYVPEPVVAQNPAGKIIVNKNKLDEIVFSGNQRMVIPPRVSVKARLGKRQDDVAGVDDVDSEEESLRQGAISTIDLRKRLGSKRKHSEDEVEEESEEDVKIRSVVKKVKKKEKKEKKEKKKKKKEKRRKSEDDENAEDTLAQRIAAQREKGRKSDDGSEERSVEYLSPSNNRKMKIKARKQSLSAEDKNSVLSVIDDVDALLKSSGSLPVGIKTDAKNDVDVMDELDELINS